LVVYSLYRKGRGNMLILKDDLTTYALDLGVWTAPCEKAGVNPAIATELEITGVQVPQDVIWEKP